MTGRGRPLRFLVAVVGGWVGVRAALLWPVAEVVPDVARVLVPPAAAERAIPPLVAAAANGGTIAHPHAEPPPFRSPAFRQKEARRWTVPARQPGSAAGPLAEPTVMAAARQQTPPVAAPLLPGAPVPPVFTASRWSGSAWAIARPGGRATPFASQLGGSQAGARLAYALGGGVAAYARVSAALDSRQQEGAVGLDWRPARAPVHLIVERRLGIAGIKGGTAAGVIGGIGPTAVGAGLRLEGYGQAGAILRERVEGFADGSLRLTRAVGPLDLGLGAWGAAQRDAARLDVGPTLGVAVPVAGRTVRVSADWRQRVAGSARPGSGPALSLGMDF